MSKPEIFHHLIVIDEQPIRRRILEQLTEAEEVLDGLNREWTIFRENDKRAFVQWIDTTFATMHAELQRLAWQIYEKRALLDAIMREAMRLGIGMAEAYRRIQKGEAGEDEPSFDEVDDEKAAYELFSEEMKELGLDINELDEEERLRMFEAFKKEHGFTESEEQDHDSAQEPIDSQPVPEPTERETRLKELYRILAKRLHPDLNGGKALSEEDRELWFRAQAAYRDKDIARLEDLVATTGGREQGDTPRDTLSLSDLLKQIQVVLSTVQDMRRRLRHAHRDRAWGFSRPGGKQRKRRIREAMQRELEREIAQTREALQALEEFFESHIAA